MSHARDVVYKSEVLGVAVHSCALPEGGGGGGGGADPWEITIL